MTTTEQSTPHAVQPQAEQSPWMSVRQAATYAGRHYKTVLGALQEYARGVRTAEALKGFQRDANCKWRVHRNDVDRWIRAEAPARGTRVA